MVVVGADGAFCDRGDHIEEEEEEEGVVAYIKVAG